MSQQAVLVFLSYFSQHRKKPDFNLFLTLPASLPLSHRGLVGGFSLVWQGIECLVFPTENNPTYNVGFLLRRVSVKVGGWV